MIKESIGYQIDYTTRNLRRYAADIFRKNDISVTMDQWAILNITKDQGGISHLTLLAQMMAKDLPTLTKMVDLLCNKGYLERQLNQKDRRKWNLILTTSGKEEEKRAFKVVEEIRKTVGNGLSEKDVVDLKRVLNKINGIIDNN